MGPLAGPGAVRPYAHGYHPFTWRGWWDFGTGALGDMACHTVNMPFMALGLRDPARCRPAAAGTTATAIRSGRPSTSSFPPPTPAALSSSTGTTAASCLRRHVLSFQEAAETVPLKDLDDEHQRDAFAAGCLVVGDKGRLYRPG